MEVVFMSLSRLPGPVGEITVEGNPTRVKASKTIAHDIVFELTPLQQERREARMLNFNPPPPPPAGYKRCTNCMTVQRVDAKNADRSAFSPDKRPGRDGFQSWCKTCRAEQARRWRQTAPNRDAVS